MTEEDIKILKELIEEGSKDLLNCWDYGEEAKQAISNVLNELERKNKIINKIKEYAHQEIATYDETIKDYIDDDRVGNADYIGELKERREHWKDIERIINNDENLYMNWWRYGLYE